MRSVFITLAAVMALAGCGGGGNESASTTSSTASRTAKTNWTRFGYDYCRDAIVANGGLSSRSSNFPGDAVKTAVFGMGATVADEKQVITGCNRAYREAVRILEGREIDDWYGDGYEDCGGDLENGGGFYNPSRESFAEEARAVGAVGDEIEQYADGCQAAYDELGSSEPQPETEPPRTGVCSPVPPTLGDYSYIDYVVVHEISCKAALRSIASNSHEFLWDMPATNSAGFRCRADWYMASGERVFGAVCKKGDGTTWYGYAQSE
jgi:hypothetical protein